MRYHKALAAALAIVVLTATPALACKRDKHRDDHPVAAGALSWERLLFRGITAFNDRDERATAASVQNAPGTKDLSAYSGLGSWVDIFNSKPWSTPGRAVRIMHNRGAEAIFLQTSTYGQGSGIYDDSAVDAYLHHAHRRGMKVVAWYVPSFDQQKIDYRRIRKAITYRSPSGERFDSFGMDIEATNVGNIAVRNERLLALSRRIRNLAGPNYPLGAITPDPVEALYWPNFPYKELADIYDVFVPMGYFTFRASGFKDVHDYTQKGIQVIRRETGDPNVPIHFIGGIADEVRPTELKGFVKAARDHEIEGASLYDYPITDRASWFEMRGLSPEVAARRRAAAAERAEAEAARLRKERAERRAKAEKKRAQNKKDGDNKRGAKDSDRDVRDRDSKKGRNDKKNDKQKAGSRDRNDDRKKRRR